MSAIVFASAWELVQHASGKLLDLRSGLEFSEEDVNCVKKFDPTMACFVVLSKSGKAKLGTGKSPFLPFVGVRREMKNHTFSS
jgi:hypothetical protein